MIDDAELQRLALLLEESDDYRVLRRLKPRARVAIAEGAATRTALFVDVETTGLDPLTDEIIELAMVPFVYALDGTILSVSKPFEGLREPSKPISPEITALTGITPAMVAGQAIDPDEVAKFVAPVSLVIAHNAAFDRGFVERLYPVFATKAWACSMGEVDWAAEGFEGTKLAYLAMANGFFYDRHRAAHDCLAAIEILARMLPNSKVPALSKLLDKARSTTWRIWAEGAAFEFKDTLKSRGYRWNGEDNGKPRSWYIDVDETKRAGELDYLRQEIYKRDVELRVTRITALDRYSNRVYSN